METAQENRTPAQLKEEADKIIQNHVLWSLGAGAIPLPLIDLIAVTGIQMDMLRQIFSLYKQDFNEAYFKSWVTSLSASFVTRLAAGSLKLIPGIGTLLGGFSQIALSGASTYAIGQVVARHLANGGASSNFNADEARDFFKEQYEKGKSYVQDLYKTGKVPPPVDVEPVSETASADDEIIRKLERLNELFKQGVLTEAEFKLMKEKLLKDLTF